MARILRMDNVNLTPMPGGCYATVCEDAVTQLGPRQFQLKNPYVPKTITAFVEHAGYPLQVASLSNSAPNIVEDNPTLGIFSFPASITHSPAYNPTITTGTIITACYIADLIDTPCGCTSLATSSAISLRANWKSDQGYSDDSAPIFGPTLLGMWNTCNTDQREWRTYCAVAEATESGKTGWIDLGLTTGMSGDYASNTGLWVGAAVSWELRAGIWDTATDGDLPWDLPDYVVLASGTEAESAYASPNFATFTPSNADCTCGTGQTAYRTIPTIEFETPVLTGDQQYWVYLVPTSDDAGWSDGVSSAIVARSDTSKQTVSWVSASLAGHVGEISSTVTFSLAECASLLAGGVSGTVSASEDAITWYAQAPGFGSSTVEDIVWSPELGIFAAAGVFVSSAKIATSPDGVTWTRRDISAGTRSIVWAAELGLFVVGGGAGGLWTSADGVVWTSRTSPFGSSIVRRIAWSPELTLFVAVADTGKLATSPDGITWTSRTSAFGALNILGVAWSPALGLFVIVGATGKLATSPDGITWTLRTQYSTSDINAVAWSPDLALFVAAGEHAADTTKLATSPDGITWTPHVSGFGSTGINAVAWWPEGGLFIAGGSSGKLATSPDGVVWTLRTSGFGTTTIRTITSRAQPVDVTGPVIALPDNPVSGPTTNQFAFDTGDQITYSVGSAYVPGSTTVWVNGLVQLLGVTYTEDPEGGQIVFDAPLDPDDIVTVNYDGAGAAPVVGAEGDSITVATIPDFKAALADDAFSEIIWVDGTYAIDPASLNDTNSLYIGSAYASRTRPVTIRPQTPGGVIFDGGDVSGTGAIWFLGGAHDQIWQDFKFANCYPEQFGIVVFGRLNASSPTAAPHHIQMLRCEVLSSCTSVETGEGDHAVYIKAATGGVHDITLDGWIVDGTGGINTFIHIYDDSGDGAHNITVSNFTVNGTHKAIMVWWSSAYNILFQNGTITNATKYAISPYRVGSGVVFDNIDSTGSGSGGNEGTVVGSPTVLPNCSLN